MPQGDKSSYTDKQKCPAELAEAGQEEGSVLTKSAEARIWAAANKLARDGKEQFLEKQELI